MLPKDGLGILKFGPKVCVGDYFTIVRDGLEIGLPLGRIGPNIAAMS